MSGRNDSDEMLAAPLIGAFFGCIGFVFLAGLALIALLMAFVAFLFTIVAFIGWNRRIRLFGEIFEPEELRAFVLRGVVGALLVPAFVLFSAILLQVHVPDEAWLYLFIGGYTAGSVGIDILMAQNARQQQVEIIPPRRAVFRSKPVEPRAIEYRFASWDDEEER